MGTSNRRNPSAGAGANKRRLKSKQRRQEVGAVIRAATLLLMPPAKTIEVDVIAQVAWHPAMRRDAVTKPTRHPFVAVAEMPRV